MTKLVKKIKYTAIIETLSGLHIGGTNAQLNIGGPDSYVIRNPLTKEPYIPGSTLKGKMRSLIELADGTITKQKGRIENGPSIDPHTAAGSLFGTSAGDHPRPSRLIVRDALLLNGEALKDTDMLYTESKTEVTIDRLTSQANPRQIERVPAGAKFGLNMVLNVFSDDNEQKLKDTVQRALKLIEDDYLGGNGSRGYGHIKLSGLKTEEKNIEKY